MASKSDYNKTLNRLITILNLLNTNKAGYLSKELADKLDVSIRTIQRDLSERLSIFPIYKYNNKWMFIDSYNINTSLSPTDSIIVAMLDKFAEGIGGEFCQVTKRVLSKIKSQSESNIYTKLNIEDISDMLSEIAIIENAINTKQTIECKYKINNKHANTTLQPLKIVNYDGLWYVLSLSDNIIKKYYLKNISNITVSSKKFDVSIDINNQLENSVSIWFRKPEHTYTVTLLVSSKVIKYLKRIPISNTQQISNTHSNGDVELEVKISHEMEIIPVVKKWLPHIKILSPSSMQDNLNQELLEYVGG